MAESFSVEAILSATDKNMSSTMKKALGSCQSFGDRVKSIVAGVGITKVIGTSMNVLSSSLDGAIDRFDTMQSYPKVMKSLGFASEQSQKSVAKLNQSVQGLPTSLTDVVTTSKSLASVTGNIDKATDTTIALNHAFLASGSSSADASRGLQQYSQMLAKGTVDMQSWRTLQETMAPALTKVAKKLGIASGNTNELYEALQNGTISFDQLNDAMIECDTETGGFADTALEASKGIKTSMTNIKSAVQNLEQGFMSAMNNMLKSKAMGGLVDNLEKIKSKIYDFRNSIMETKDDGLTWDFKPGVMENVSKAMDWLADRANNAKAMIQQFYDGFMKTDAVQNAITMFDKIKDAIGNVMDKLQDSKVFEQLGQDIGNIIAKVEDVTSKIADFVANLKTEDVKKFAGAVKLLAGAFVGIKVGSKVSSMIGGVVGSAKSGYSKLKSIIDKIKGVGGTEGAPTSSPSSSGVPDIGNASIQTAQKTSKAAQIINSAFEGISNVIQSFGETVSGILNSVSGVIKSIGQSALNAGKGFKQLANGIKIITSLNLIDMGASLGAVAVGIGAIATASSGMGDTGAQMMALATALTMIVSTQAGIESLSATIPLLSDSLSSLSGISEPLTAASGAMTAFAGAIAPIASSVMATATSIAMLVTVASTISSAFTSASSSTVTSINAIVTAMTNAEAKATTSGTVMGTKFTKGLSSGLKTGVSVAKSSCQSILSAFNSCQSRAYYCGQMIGQGLANGLRASEGSVRAAAASLAAAADAAIQAKAKIGSPSKVTRKDGMWIGKGLIIGLESMYSDVKRASEDLLYLPMLDAPKMAFGGIVSDMNPDYEYTNNAQLTIETPLYINDREFARATYRANQSEFDKHSKFNERLRGNK